MPGPRRERNWVEAVGAKALELGPPGQPLLNEVEVGVIGLSHGSAVGPREFGLPVRPARVDEVRQLGLEDVNGEPPVRRQVTQTALQAPPLV